MAQMNYSLVHFLPREGLKVISIMLLGVLASCAPPSNTMADQEPDPQSTIPSPSSTATSSTPETSNPLPDSTAKGDTRIHVTISCHRGTIPGTNLTSMPINAYVAIVDEKYLEGLTARLVSGEEDYSPFIADNIGEDGIIDLDFNEDRKYDVMVAAMDERLQLSAAIVSDAAWNRLKVQKGTTVHKNFIMAQAWCDKDREIRGIDPQSYNIQVLDFSPDYDDISVAGFGVKKRFYARATSAGAFKYYVNYRTNLNGKKRGPYLENGSKSMIITNVQSETHIKRTCGAEGNVDMIIKSDGALGVKTYSGTADNEIIECKQAYLTHYPYTYAGDYDDVTTPDAELYIRQVDSHNTMHRTSCPTDIDAKVASAPVTYPGACLESTITHTNIFERDPSASEAFPWGRLHKYSYRYDLTKPEEVEGKVPPTLLP